MSTVRSAIFITGAKRTRLSQVKSDKSEIILLYLFQQKKPPIVLLLPLRKPTLRVLRLLKFSLEMWLPLSTCCLEIWCPCYVRCFYYQQTLWYVVDSRRLDWGPSLFSSTEPISLFVEERRRRTRLRVVPLPSMDWLLDEERVSAEASRLRISFPWGWSQRCPLLLV